LVHAWCCDGRRGSWPEKTAEGRWSVRTCVTETERERERVRVRERRSERVIESELREING
jgi:hypothetical protein